ncbi:hypothetical protein J6500_21415 [Bradyrhizobium sp. WSM 1704]|uniref:hypothetical protein n=1 Tax=Bradyrhizobium semiaridum TaxID=2821404 RepID=UPI001CE319D9|nr:hypothetical protein [Bradyrhizobium semiaridum]MCA6124430.1 hypothetical protein [Bradyrhizobium semiaridum]
MARRQTLGSTPRIRGVGVSEHRPCSHVARPDEEASPTKPVTVAPAPQPQQPQPGQSDLVAATPPEPAAAPDRTQQASSPAPGTQTAAREPSATSEIRNANARAREADVRRATAEKRRAERRQRWAERRRMRQDDDLRDVEQRVREATDGPHLLAADPVRVETSRMGLFETDGE